jgi:hypothetical protein
MTLTLPGGFGAIKGKTGFRQMFSREPLINWLAAARLFLFGARDVWFVVALPVFLVSIGWDFHWVGAYLALWVIGYGLVQSAAPWLLGTRRPKGAIPSGNAGDGPNHGSNDGPSDGPGARTAVAWSFALVLPLGALLLAIASGQTAGWMITLGLAFFGVVFAILGAAGINLLEILVGFIQAYIFTFLTCLFNSIIVINKQLVHICHNFSSNLI